MKNAKTEHLMQIVELLGKKAYRTKPTKYGDRSWSDDGYVIFTNITKNEVHYINDGYESSLKYDDSNIEFIDGNWKEYIEKKEIVLNLTEKEIKILGEMMFYNVSIPKLIVSNSPSYFDINEVKNVMLKVKSKLK